MYVWAKKIREVHVLQEMIFFFVCVCVLTDFHASKLWYSPEADFLLTKCKLKEGMNYM